LINCKLGSIYEILRDSSSAKVLSDEGPIALKEFLSSPQDVAAIVTAHR
jgi:hypothetical protein